MSPLAGVNHITVLTGDLDPLAAFYEEVFGAPKPAAATPRARHVTRQ